MNASRPLSSGVVKNAILIPVPTITFRPNANMQKNIIIQNITVNMLEPSAIHYPHTEFFTLNNPVLGSLSNSFSGELKGLKVTMLCMPRFSTGGIIPRTF